MRIVIVLLIGFCLAGCQSYPSVDDLPRSNGIIHHPTYGDYPEKVEFEQGMTIMPGQSAVGTAIIEFPAIEYKEGGIELFNVDELEEK
jgi:hypothetical protein